MDIIFVAVGKKHREMTRGAARLMIPRLGQP